MIRVLAWPNALHITSLALCLCDDGWLVSFHHKLTSMVDDRGERVSHVCLMTTELITNWLAQTGML